VNKDGLVVAENSLFNECKSETGMCGASKEVQLSRNTTPDDSEQQLRQDLEIFLIC
jgi:hypothetical protein